MFWENIYFFCIVLTTLQNFYNSLPHFLSFALFYFFRSQNGSPVDQYDPGELVITIKKQRRGVVTNNGIITTSAVPSSSSSFPINIGIGAGNGETIDLSDPNQRKNLDEEQKAHAMQQLMAMQEQMKNLMAEW